MILVRYADNSDIPTISEMLTELCDYHVALLPDIFVSAEGAFGVSYVENLLADINRAVLIAEIDGVRAGLAVFNVENRPRAVNATPAKTIKITDIFVSESYRQLGVGRALIEYIEQLAESLAVDYVKLTCWYANSCAYEFYKSLGYEVKSVVMTKTINDKKE